MSKYGVVNNLNGTVTINEDYFEELLNDSLFINKKKLTELIIGMVMDMLRKSFTKTKKSNRF